MSLSPAADPISNAKTLIGQEQGKDYILRATEHAKLYEKSAPALARVLMNSEVQSIARQYEAKDAQAGEAQNLFKKTAGRANLAVLLTSCVSAAVLVTAPFSASDAQFPAKELQVALGAAGVLVGALGAMWLSKLQAGRFLDRWVKPRTAAEALRVSYFEKVTAQWADTTPPVGAPLPLLQLEYFRRYQLEVQLSYFRNRAADHQKAADRWLTIGAVAVALAASATGIAGVLAASLDPRWAAIAGLSVLATAVSSWASRKEALGQNTRNVERYGKTVDALETFAARLDDVRRATAANDRAPMEQFVAGVQEQLSSEHRQWLETAETTNAAVAKLDESLSKTNGKSTAPKQNPANPPATQ